MPSSSNLGLWVNPLFQLSLDKSKIQTLLSLCKHHSILPIDLPHYLNETGHPINEPLTELMSDCKTALSIMTSDKVMTFIDTLPNNLKMFVDFQMPRVMDSFLKEKIAVLYLISLLNLSYYSLKDAIQNDLEKSEVLKRYPEIRAKLDKDYLLEIDGNFELFDGGIGYKEHVLHYHQLLRRVYTANPNFAFLGRLQKYYTLSKSKNTFKIAIDHRRLMPRQFYNQLFELDHWYGPRFDIKKIDDPNEVGLTVMTRKDQLRFDTQYKLYRTEIYWSYRDQIKSLEIEELSTENFKFDHYYINRYVHSQRNVNSKRLDHFDGAAKVYYEQDYGKRLNTKIPKEAKASKMIKLFRIDGDLDVDFWIDLVSHFFKGNEMIIEYFDPELYNQMYDF
jgi:hypothetical protein